MLQYLDENPDSLDAAAATPPLRDEDRSGRPSCHGDGLQACDNSSEFLMKAEIRHGVREEMAHTLADVAFRRTTLGIAGDPGDTHLRTCAAIMAKEFGWDTTRTQRELEEVREVFSTRT